MAQTDADASSKEWPLYTFQHRRALNIQMPRRVGGRERGGERIKRECRETEKEGGEKYTYRPMSRLREPS